jgi:hypothetical protein
MIHAFTTLCCSSHACALRPVTQTRHPCSYGARRPTESRFFRCASHETDARKLSCASFRNGVALISSRQVRVSASLFFPWFPTLVRTFRVACPGDAYRKTARNQSCVMHALALSWLSLGKAQRANAAIGVIAPNTPAPNETSPLRRRRSVSLAFRWRAAQAQHCPNGNRYADGFLRKRRSHCCAATDPGNHAAALKMVTMQNGVFGAVSDSRSALSALL